MEGVIFFDAVFTIYQYWIISLSEYFLPNLIKNQNPKKQIRSLLDITEKEWKDAISSLFSLPENFFFFTKLH